MGELDSLALPHEIEGVLADDVAAAERHDADLVERTRSDVAASAMNDGPLRVELLGMSNDFTEAHGGAARGVDLSLVMDLHDLGIKAGAEELGGARGEKVERVDTLAVVRREDDGHMLGGPFEGSPRLGIEPGVPMTIGMC